MENLTWQVVASAVVTVVLFLWKGVPFFTWVSNQITEWRKRRAENASKHLSESADIRRIEIEDREKSLEAVWEIVEEKKAEIKDLKTEISELRKDDSLSRPALARLYQTVRKLGSQIEIVDSIFVKEFLKKSSDDERQKLIEAIKKEMEILWQKFDELERSLPQ